MSFDYQMIRTDEPGFTNLAVGEPYILQEQLQGTAVYYSPQQTYPQLNGEKDLLKELGLLYPDKYIVVTNGAKQALLAAIHAIKICNSARPRGRLVHEAPYWPSFPTLAKVSNLEFEDWANCDSGCVCASCLWEEPWSIRCITSPNNPDGKQTVNPCDIHDGVYLHSVYGWNGKLPESVVRVESASKIFGMSGCRVGWLLTDDKNIADYAAHYVEITTSGVSTVSQCTVANKLYFHRQSQESVQKQYGIARSQMKINAEIFNENLYKFCDTIEGCPHDGTGMFAWFKIKNEYLASFQKALAEYKILLVTGQACGMKEDGWYRMSMGHYNAVTAGALYTLGKALNG